MKKIISIALLLCVIFVCSACTVGNNKRYDSNYTFKHAIILLPNGSNVEGSVEWWTDFDDGDEVQIKMNGKVYLTHYSNVVLISE